MDDPILCLNSFMIAIESSIFCAIGAYHNFLAGYMSLPACSDKTASDQVRVKIMTIAMDDVTIEGVNRPIDELVITVTFETYIP